MKQLISMIQDGEGNTSSMRVIMILVVACVILPPTILAIRTGGTVQWSQTDFEIIAAVVTGKLGQSFFENKAPSAPPSTPAQTLGK